jgi:hypothetical protein
MTPDKLIKTSFEQGINQRIKTPIELSDWLSKQIPFVVGPSIIEFEPVVGQPGCLINIIGTNFSSIRTENTVEIGGQPALVVNSSSTSLKAITARGVSSGPVKVTIGSKSAIGPQDFKVLGYPSSLRGEDGPPIAFSGTAVNPLSNGDVNPIGTLNLLVVLLRPNDQVPANPATTRNTVTAAWDQVSKYYDQASYGKTVVKVDTTTNWAVLDGTMGDFLSGDNIDSGQLNRITAQAAQAAVNEGFNLDNYAMMACVVFLNNTFIRAWGGWSQSNFAYNNGLPAGDPNKIDININVNHDLNLLTIQETANWGRCAHEFGHNVVSAPGFLGEGTATLGEDIYSSDLVDPNAASARQFDLMGSHDNHPLFSGYHLDKLGYYKKDPAIPGDIENITELIWDRNPTSREFEIVAHGLSRNTSVTRSHLVKIKVTDGLYYYIQVRQRPGSTTQIFDENIPLDGAINQGGVIITSVISDTLHTNQQTRFITLMHDERVLRQGQFAQDPARTIKITVLNDNVQSRPQVCRVKVEWAQTVSDDPNGSFDLRIDPWDNNWQTPDIWIDRSPFGTFDNGLDSQGRPTGNGDEPMVGQINQFHSRVHVSGAMGAQNVAVTYYAVFPPGVGDNGNWGPLALQTIANIPQNGYADSFCDWVPVVGQHTCLKVYAGQQLGEVSGGNNSAQENVFNFESPSGSPGEPIIIRTAMRNPLDRKSLAIIAIQGVPRGWSVYFPHSWVWLEAKAERQFDMVIVPDYDYAQYQERKIPVSANIRIEGLMPREYKEPLPPLKKPAGSRFYPIGGLLYRAHLLKRSQITLRVDKEKTQKNAVAFAGIVSPVYSNQRIRVELVNPNGALRVREVMTDSLGKYRVSFNLSFEPSLEADNKKWKKAKKLVPGVYRCQAFIFNATILANAESNIIFTKL